MNDVDDQTWLDALAGRTAAAEALPAREAEHLRAGILSRAVESPTPVAAEDAAREDELIARARRAGLIRPAAAVARPGWWTGWRGVATLAAAASVVIVIGVVTRPALRQETVRSAPGRVVRLESHDPRSLQRALVGELGAVGVKAVAYERLGAYGVDADLPVPVTQEVREVLERHRLAVPPDGALAVEIVEPAPK